LEKEKDYTAESFSLKPQERLMKDVQTLTLRKTLKRYSWAIWVNLMNIRGTLDQRLLTGLAYFPYKQRELKTHAHPQE